MHIAFGIQKDAVKEAIKDLDIGVLINNVGKYVFVRIQVPREILECFFITTSLPFAN